MTDIDAGSVQANGLEFHYLHAGRGPLALCYHGFPDSPWSYRHLLPALADAGYHAVAPFARGFAPTQLPATATTCTPAQWWPTSSPSGRRSTAARTVC